MFVTFKVSASLFEVKFEYISKKDKKEHDEKNKKTIFVRINTFLSLKCNPNVTQFEKYEKKIRLAKIKWGKIKVARISVSIVAEERGFEPPMSFPTPVFKTGAFNHSATPPS